MATVGSRGDVAPFTGLGVRLRAAGHHVAGATHTTLAESVRAAGLEFRPLPVDPRAELASAEGRRLLRADSGPPWRQQRTDGRERMTDFIICHPSSEICSLNSLGQAPAR
ncbi:glycosyltransferase [Kitasatospora sp. NPDC001683]